METSHSPFPVSVLLCRTEYTRAVTHDVGILIICLLLSFFLSRREQEQPSVLPVTIMIIVSRVDLFFARSVLYL